MALVPENTVLTVDRFHGKDALSSFLLQHLFKTAGFPLRNRQIRILGDADRGVPIVNYADLLGCRIGSWLERRNTWLENAPEFRPAVPYEVKRVPSADEHQRASLEYFTRAYKMPSLLREMV
jgi:hypothetical protein